VLKITHIPGNDSIQLFKLEGKLLGPWVRELDQACYRCPGPPSRIQLDLSGVTVVDEAGIQMLHYLLNQGGTVVACSGFVAALLRIDPPAHA
jgi:hypothetical protein